MSKIFSAALFWCLMATSVFSQSSENPQQRLMIGDSAPGMTGASWMRGGPVGEWRNGHVYLLDFWATWCAPCLEMMPATQALEDRHTEDQLHVVGVAIWSQKGPMTPAQALAKHPGLTYAVAEDSDDRLADRFMGGTGARGLPTFMLIDRSGRLAWVGEPGDEFDEALEEIINGTFNLAAARKTDEIRRKGQALFSQIDEFRRDGQPRQAAGLVDSVIALDEQRNGWAYAMKYEILVTDCDAPEEALEVAAEFLAGKPGRNPFFNYAFALRITREDGSGGPQQRELDLGLRLARRAVNLTDEPNPEYLAMLARIHSLRGELDDAIRWQRLAIEAAPQAQIDSLSETLHEYERTAGSQG
jgi:thiol-disulfide isomerase/thioredoxin